MTRVLNTKVNGVTFDNRQKHIRKLAGNEPCMIVPEPENRYDSNALAVMVAFEGEVLHVGYVPREIAAEIAPHLEGENVVGRLIEITGGFDTGEGNVASLGLRIRVEIPE